MLARQNEDAALRLLIAQRRLYSRAKRWLGLRWFGMLVIGLTAPVVSVVWSDLAVVSGAIAGSWIFLGRTVLASAQATVTDKAAAVQQQFDFHVFRMPARIERPTLPSVEEIYDISGCDSGLKAMAVREHLVNWYTINPSHPGDISVAIAQRANAAYSDRLLRETAILWAELTAIWVAVIAVASEIAGISMKTFLVGVALPILPALLDVVEYISDTRIAARSRGDLAGTIGQRLKRDSEPIDGDELLAWQKSLYELRRSAPQVPDFIYRVKRSTNERVMKSAALQLGNGKLMERAVFISYRSEDSHSYGALLYTELSRQFGLGRVFLDAESIPAGADFAEELVERVRSARIVLAVVGPRWLAVADPVTGRRRIDDPDDWVHRELAEAFAAGVRVIPVLTDDAELPPESDLPVELAAFSRCQYRHLRRHEPMTDLARIVADIVESTRLATPPVA